MVDKFAGQTLLVEKKIQESFYKEKAIGLGDVRFEAER